jgi:predicted ribonuclease toxin of YeeF-YezG toxin-antitoxin module
MRNYNDRATAALNKAANLINNVLPIDQATVDAAGEKLKKAYKKMDSAMDKLCDAYVAMIECAKSLFP